MNGFALLTTGVTAMLVLGHWLPIITRIFQSIKLSSPLVAIRKSLMVFKHLRAAETLSLAGVTGNFTLLLWIMAITLGLAIAKNSLPMSKQGSFDMVRAYFLVQR
jgi:hypothetical protein